MSYATIMKMTVDLSIQKTFRDTTLLQLLRDDVVDRKQYNVAFPFFSHQKPTWFANSVSHQRRMTMVQCDDVV